MRHNHGEDGVCPNCGRHVDYGDYCSGKPATLTIEGGDELGGDERSPNMTSEGSAEPETRVDAATSSPGSDLDSHEEVAPPSAGPSTHAFRTPEPRAEPVGWVVVAWPTPGERGSKSRIDDVASVRGRLYAHHSEASSQITGYEHEGGWPDFRYTVEPVGAPVPEANVEEAAWWGYVCNDCGQPWTDDHVRHGESARVVLQMADLDAPLSPERIAREIEALKKARRIPPKLLRGP